MALVQIGPVSHDADLVVFDKDGTLLDFEAMWGRLAEAWMEELTRAGDARALATDLYRSLGYDPLQRRTDPQGPLAIATTNQLQTIAAVTLYRHGLSWPEAEERVQDAFRQASADLPLPSLIQPAGDVAGLLESLHGAGLRVAVVTTDDRYETEEALRILGVAHLVEHLVCGDDRLPSKPAPDMLLAACQGLQVPPGRTVVVGDTLSDLLMAERAGAGLKVAVLTGAGDPALLEAHADVVIPSIDDIQIT